VSPHDTPTMWPMTHHQSNRGSTFLYSRSDDQRDFMDCGFTLRGFDTSQLRHFASSALRSFDTSRLFPFSSNHRSGEVPKPQNFTILPLWIYGSHYSGFQNSYQIGRSVRLCDFGLFHASSLYPIIVEAMNFQSFSISFLASINDCDRSRDPKGIAMIL
jgi:hypothetical protein